MPCGPRWLGLETHGRKGGGGVGVPLRTEAGSDATAGTAPGVGCCISTSRARDQAQVGQGIPIVLPPGPAGHPRPRFKAYGRVASLEIDQTAPGMVQGTAGKGHVKIKGLANLHFKPGPTWPDAQGQKKIVLVYKVGILTVTLTYAVTKSPLPPLSWAAGLDRGMHPRAALSDGSVMPRRKGHPRWEKLSPRVSSATKGSRTRRQRVRALQQELRRDPVRNRNACHRYTAARIKTYGLRALEDPTPDRRPRSAQDTVVHPDTHVQAKGGLNQAIRRHTGPLIRSQQGPGARGWL